MSFVLEASEGTSNCLHCRVGIYAGHSGSITQLLTLGDLLLSLGADKKLLIWSPDVYTAPKVGCKEAPMTSQRHLPAWPSKSGLLAIKPSSTASTLLHLDNSTHIMSLAVQVNALSQHCKAPQFAKLLHDT